MITPHVNHVLGKQKSRIGNILGAIDKELPNHTDWKQLGLKNLWNEYMDMKFTTAVARTRYSMDTHLKQAEQRWIRDARNQHPDQQTLQHRELRDMIRAISKRWKKDRNAWTRPASWGVKGGVSKNRHPNSGARVGSG